MIGDKEQQTAAAPESDLLVTGIEEKLRLALVAGEWVDFRVGDERVDDPRNSMAWGPERTVDAAIISALLTTKGADPPGRSLRVRGVRVVGSMDFEFRTLLFPLILEGCHLERVVLEQARAVIVWFEGCVIDSFSADQLDAQLNVGFPGTSFSNGASLRTAHVRGQLTMTGAHVVSSDGKAFDGNALTVDGSVFCNEGFVADGRVDLVAAHIGGQLTFAGANLNNPHGTALDGNALTVDGNVFCNEGFVADGKVELVAAHIGGQLTFAGANLNNPDGIALDGELLTVDGHVFCNGGFVARGGISLFDARMGRDLMLSGADLKDTGGLALNAEALEVAGSVSCNAFLSADGGIVFARARIRGSLDLTDAQLSHSSGTALAADGLVVSSQMSCAGGFQFEGGIELRNGDIGRFTFALSEPSAEVVLFAGTKVGYLDDSVESWPSGLHLDKLMYTSLRGLSQSGSVSARLKWLRIAEANEGYRPRSYDQLARTYREAGYDDAARVVLVAKQRARARSLSARYSVAHEEADLARTQGMRQRLVRSFQHRGRLAWDWFLTYSVGYGYRPGRIVFWLMGAVLVASVAFAFLHPEHVQLAKNTPTDKSFVPVLYSLDILLPVANLGQRTSFVLYGPAEWVAAALTIVGWLFGAVLIAGLSGVFKRD